MEMSSPSVKYASVGAAIVVGARESRVQGEGRQGRDVRQTNSQRSPWESLVEPGDPGRSDERSADDRRGGKSPLPEEPGAGAPRGAWM